MTKETLTIVRTLRKRIREEESRLKDLREAEQFLSSKLDGLPRTQSATSKVERVALARIEQFQLVERLKDTELTCAAELLSILLREIKDPDIRQLLICRYVYCYSFNKVQRILNLSMSGIFRLHREGLKLVEQIEFRN